MARDSRDPAAERSLGVWLSALESSLLGNFGLSRVRSPDPAEPAQMLLHPEPSRESKLAGSGHGVGISGRLSRLPKQMEPLRVASRLPGLQQESTEHQQRQQESPFTSLCLSFLSFSPFSFSPFLSVSLCVSLFLPPPRAKWRSLIST